MRIPMEDWLRGCAYHDGRHGEVMLPTDKVLEIANYIQLTRTSLTDGMIELPPYDRKTENSSEKPNNCDTCANGEGDVEACGYCRHGDLYEPKDEPQTEPLQTCSVNGRPYNECSSCEHFRCTADEPQTERSE